MLTQTSPLLYWYAFPDNQNNATLVTERIQALEQSGVQASALHDLMAVYTLAADQHEQANQTIFLLQGEPHQLFATLSRLRSINQQVGVIVLCPLIDESFLIQMLHSGVDGYGLTSASDPLVLALVNNVWRRISSTFSQPIAVIEGAWHLTAKGWVLISPQGDRISLTTTERQLLHALLTQPGRRADHRTLLNVLDGGEETPITSGQNRLGVIISRLKKKAETKKIEMPLRSIHRWGYMFAAQVAIDDDIDDL